MQINDFKNIQEAIKYEVLQDEKEYLKLLKVIGNNQKYDFSSQLSIYNKEPEARACATFDMWKKYFGRVVMRGQKGIPILAGSDVTQRVSYIFDISQTTSMDRNINEVSLWQFDHENHNEALKEIINDFSFEASDSLNENIFSLSRIYGDEYINLALADLRIDIEDRLSFEKFMRDSISYAVANRFNIAYPMDMENLKNNFSRINTISLEQIGLVISRVSEEIIDGTIEKSKEMDRARLLTERAAADYNRDIENINEDRGGQNDLYILQTTSDNIYQQFVGGKTLRQLGAYGINGSFFDTKNPYSTKSVWSIAVNNYKPIGENADRVSYNAKDRRGTFVINRDNSIEIRIVNNINELKKPKFAVSGLTLIPYYNPHDERIAKDILRCTNHTAIAYKEKNVFLIATKKRMHMSEFKDEIQKTINPDGAIALDGGGSTEFYYKGLYKGSGRPLASIIGIKEV